jgi:hypothetical protein
MRDNRPYDLKRRSDQNGSEAKQTNARTRAAPAIAYKPLLAAESPASSKGAGRVVDDNRAAENVRSEVPEFGNRFVFLSEIRGPAHEPMYPRPIMTEKL